ncbi:MAG: hypothetical protein ABRQ39_23745 [Candidatus Eremiobacterota bacterium]
MNGKLNRDDFTYMVERIRTGLERDVYKVLFQEYSVPCHLDKYYDNDIYWKLPSCETYPDMKEIIRKGFSDVSDDMKQICYKIIDNLMFYREIPYIFVLFSPEMVTEIYNIFSLLKNRKKSGVTTAKTEFPVTTGDILHKYISDFDDTFSLFPSFDIVRKIRVLLEADIDKIIDEFISKLKKLDRIIKVVDFQDDSVFKDFLGKMKREGLDKKLSSIAFHLSGRFFISPEEEKDIKKIFDLLIEAVNSLKIVSLSGERKLSKVTSIFSLIIDSKKNYKELNKELIRDRELIILFNEEIKNNCKAIGFILKKIILEEEEFITKILKGYYFSCLSRETGCSERFCKEAYEIVKNISEEIEKKKLREACCDGYKPLLYPAIVIKELCDNFLVDIPPYIPEHLIINNTLPWNVKEEAKNELEFYRRYCNDLKKLGSFLSEKLFPTRKFPDVMKKIYEIKLDYTVISQITGIPECELLKIFLSEFLQIPDGSVIPLRLFLTRKKDFLNDNCEEIKRHLNKNRSDNDIARRLNEKYDYLPPGWLTGKDIKEFRRKNNIVKHRGRKRKFSEDAISRHN